MTAPGPADPLGFDAFLDADLDRGGRSATGLELVANAIPHRLMCAALPRIDAPDGEIPFGVNVRAWVGEPITTRPDGTSPELEAKVPLVDGALQLDPRIAQTSTTITPAPPGATLTDGSKAQILIAITFTTITGATVSRVVGVSAVSVGFLASE